MPDHSTRRFKFLRIYCETSAITVVLIGCLVLIGWALHVQVLLSVFPGLVTMKVNTALCLGLLGTSLRLLLPNGSAGTRVNVARFLALSVVLIGAASLCEYLLRVNLGIDELLFIDSRGSFGTSSPGRMAPTTATAFLALGLALLMVDWRTRRGRRPSQELSLFAGLIAMMALAGYLYHAAALYRLFLYTKVALHTAIAVFFLSTAVFFARPRNGIAGELTGDGSGSIMARRFLPAVFLIPVTLGWTFMQGQNADLYGPELGWALFATSNVLVFAVLVWWSSRQMNKEHNQRCNAERGVRDLNAELEERVAQRTRALEFQTTVLTKQAALLDLTHDSIFARDINQRITYWNHGAARKYGWTAEQVFGRLPHELLQTRFPIPQDEISAELLLHDRWEGELVHTAADQSRITMASRWALQRDSRGNPCAILETNTDITERKQAQEALRLADEKLRLLVTGVKDYVILMLDPQGRVTTWNEGGFRIKGYRAEEIIGQHFSTFYTPEDIAQGRPARGLKIAAEQGRFEDEGWRIRKDGTRFLANVVIAALHDTAGNLRGFAKVTRDITERVEVEKAREEMHDSKLRFKDEFLSHVSHELRSPLTAIKQFTSIILSGLAGELSTEQVEYQEIILRNVLQLQSMIDDLLEVTRLETGKLTIDAQSTSVSRALAEALDTLRSTARAKDVAISCDLLEDLPAVFADPIRLRQILVILIDNAIKFTPSGGEVKIRAAVDQDAAFLNLEVSDTGPGIDPDTVDKIFDRLYQEVEDSASSSRKGLGLGLFICKELVQRHGGLIRVTSGPQQGSTFSFTVPVVSIDNPIGTLLRQTDLAVSYTMLQPDQDVGAATEDTVTTMATNIRKSIPSQIFPEAVFHE